MADPRYTIARVIARLNIGGPAIHVILLTGRYSSSLFRTVLLSGREAASEGNMYALAEQEHVAVTFLERLGREISLWSDVTSLWELWRKFRQLKPTIVDTHTAKAGTIGRVAALLARVPIRVHTFHGHTFHGYWGPRKTRVFIAIERLLARHTDCIIGVSQQVCDDLLALGIGTPATVRHIPLGLDLSHLERVDQYTGWFRRELHVSADTPLIGIVARLVPIKRHDVFLEAARRVHEKCPEAKFVLVGDGELRDDLEAQIHQLGLDDVVLRPGWIEDLAKVYADLDIVCLTSDNEGLPVCLIEAMAAGCPVVATNVGGVGELVRENKNGHLAPAGDSEALAAGILHLLQNPATRETMGHSARERTLQSYTIDRLARDMDALYRELLHHKGYPTET